MENNLYEKIGKQEMVIESLRRQNAELSALISKFIAGEESTEDWSINQAGQLVRKTAEPTTKRTHK